MIKQLREEGMAIADEMKIYEHGNFFHMPAGEGNRIESGEANDTQHKKAERCYQIMYF